MIYQNMINDKTLGKNDKKIKTFYNNRKELNEDLENEKKK